MVTHKMPEKGRVLSTLYYEWMGVLASFLVAVIKYPSKCSLGEKGLIWLTGYSPSRRGSHNSRSLRKLVTLYPQSRAEGSELRHNSSAQFAFSIFRQSRYTARGKMLPTSGGSPPPIN